MQIILNEDHLLLSDIEEYASKARAILVDDDNKIIVANYNGALLLPGGSLDKNETPIEALIRELKEETGYSTDSLKLIHKYYTSPGFSNQMVFIYLAKNLIPGERNLEEDEFLEVYEMDIKEAYNMIMSNEICDSKTVIGLLLTKELL